MNELCKIEQTNEIPEIPEIMDNELPFHITNWLEAKRIEAELTEAKKRVEAAKAGIVSAILKRPELDKPKIIKCGNAEIHFRWTGKKEGRLITQYDVGHPMPGSARKESVSIQINEIFV